MKGYWLLPGFLSAFWLSTAVQAATIEDEYIHPVRYQPHVTTDGERVIMPAPKPQVMSGIRTTLPVLVAQAVGAIAPIVDRTVDRVEVPPNTGRLLDGLQQRVTTLWSKFPSLRSYDAGVFVLDLDNGNYLNLHGDKVFPAARDYIQAVSRVVYTYLSQPTTSASTVFP